ncbi:pentapeptide repeat-containing protein [Maricaulis sp.]|uniref:pentapeptide repeat-containing protein n=1 Tax=Maricaulis sp. TaxID=1486257 RepID=UPI002624679E|nr:pentapeptide repeat-containing protein [Maricaulis sp.]
MARLFASLILLAALSLPATAHAQNRGEIARVQAGQSCSGCNLFQADLSYRELRNLDLSGSRLRQSNLSLVIMDGSRFDGANMSIANLFGARFVGASFRDTDLSDAVLVGTYFNASNLAGANLTGANLSGAYLSDVRGLTQHQLDRACGDADTLLPPGLHIADCRLI